MMVRQWISAAQEAGWVVGRVSALEITMKCGKAGCPGTITVPIDNTGPPPPPCQLPHERGYAAKVFASYQATVEELVRRRRSLGLDQIDLNDAAGLTEGHISKLESFARIATPPTLHLWAETLGLYITTAPAPLPPATLRAIESRRNRPYQEQQARWGHTQAAQPALPLDPRKQDGDA